MTIRIPFRTDRALVSARPKRATLLIGRSRRLRRTGLAAGLVFLMPAGGSAGEPPVRATECVGNQGTAAEPSCDPEWSLKHTGADRAKEMLREMGKEPGAGIIVGVLDTGYATVVEGGQEMMHPELGDALLVERGYAFECDEDYDARRIDQPIGCCYHCKGELLPGERQARDRMDKTPLPFGRQPGHGTGTMSVLVSPDDSPVTPAPNADARVVGVAPGAHVVPLRATQGSVLMEKRAWDMARGIGRLVLDDPEGREPELPPVDVISISFGRRAPHAQLEKAVLLAERRGIIVVAAAGQGALENLNGGPVRFPAQYPSVVGVGGTRVDARPWTGLLSTGKGRALDVAAPAVDVWRAHAEGKERQVTFSIGRGKGTSFATPQVAGAAALWLQRHGRDKLQVRYGRAAVPAAFLLHLRTRGVRTPEEMADLTLAKGLPNAAEIRIRASEGWPENMGPGILAVDKLIADPIDQLPTRAEVCEFVYRERGAEALATVCPPRHCPRDPAAACGADQVSLQALLSGALVRPGYHVDPPISLVVGLTFGAPFGRSVGELYSPAVSLGIINRRHQYRIPRGFLAQAKAGEHGISVGVGYADLQEYGPLRDAEDRYATIPGFGGMLGYSIKLGYLRTERRNHLGVEVGFSLYRGKLNAGVYWPIHEEGPRKYRWTWDLGFGF